MKQVILFLWPLLFAFTTGCTIVFDDYTPASFQVDGDQAVMTGVIDGTTPEEVQLLIDDYPNVTTIIMQHVEGSADDEANLIAARLIRQHGFDTHVPADGLIASGGVDFFLAGVERTADSGAKLGVHSWATGDGITGDQIPRDNPQHELYLDYYTEMGIPAEFYWFTLRAAPAEDIYYMTPAEMAQYQMITTLQ
ncbi:MAG: alpha/beta hydrolase [Chloroflexota bacterium]